MLNFFYFLILKAVIKYLFYNLYYITRILSVWHYIDSAPGCDTDLRLVSLEPAWPEPAILGKNFSEKWPMAKLSKKNFMPLMLFYGKNIGLFVLMFESNHFFSFWAIRTIDHEIMLWEVLREGFNVSIFIYIYNTQNLCVCARVTALLLSPRHNTNLRRCY
jgi:hypothetical protein